MVILETNRLRLRQWTDDDWLEARPMFTDPRVMRYIGDGSPRSDEQIQRFISRGIEAAQTRGWLLWPVEFKQNGALIGFCGFHDGYPPDVEIGWRLLPEYWGKGLATEMARTVMDYGFTTWNFPRLISVAQPANLASIRIMEKLGMRFEARIGCGGAPAVRYVKDREKHG